MYMLLNVVNIIKAESTGIVMWPLNNKLQGLLKAVILDRVAIGIFVLNPYLFGNSDCEAINAK